jgi:hypothetical protein
MGVAPEAIVEKSYFKYRLKYIVPIFTHPIVALFDNIVGSALGAPDGSSLEAIVKYFRVLTQRISFSSLIPLYLLCQCFVDFIGHHQYVDMSHHTFAEFPPISVHHLSYSDSPVTRILVMSLTKSLFK